MTISAVSDNVKAILDYTDKVTLESAADGSGPSADGYGLLVAGTGTGPTAVTRLWMAVAMGLPLSSRPSM